MCRMQKKVMKIIGATFMGFIFCLNGFGCDLGKSESEVYRDLVDATASFFDYKDAITINMRYIIEENGEETENAKITYSIDPDNHKMYYCLKSKNADIAIKVFKSGKKHYLLSKVKTWDSVLGGTASYEVEEYSELPEEAVEMFTSSIQSFSMFSEQDLDTIFKTYTFDLDETRAAYESVYAEQLAKKNESDDRAFAEYKITTDSGFNSVSLNEYSQIKMGGFSRSSGYGVYTVTEESKLTEKSGKIAQIRLEREIAFLGLSYEALEQKEKRIIKIDIDYSFDKSGYKNIKTDVSDYEVLYDYSEDFKLKFDVGGVITEKTTTAYAYQPQRIFDNLTKDFQVGGCNIEWYYDSAYTKPFVAADLTYDDFHNVPCVYGKVTVLDGYAIIAKDYRVSDERTDAYKAVFGPIFESRQDYERFEKKKVQTQPDLQLDSTMNGAALTSINGSAYDNISNILQLESGKLYLLEYTQSFTNEDYSIFDIDVSSLWIWGEGVMDL